MIDFKEITIGDKALFDSYLKGFSPQASELTFTNLFIWRKYYNFRFCEISGLLCVIALEGSAGTFALMPLGLVDSNNLDTAVKALKRFFEENGMRLVFKRVEEGSIKYFFGMVAENSITFDRDSSDYVYLKSDLSELPGKKYDGKRNHINKFNRLYQFEYVSLETGLIEECRRISREWCVVRNCHEHIDLFCEKIAIHELLQNYESLQYKGALIKVNGRYEAYSIGEKLNEDTAVIHIEKANTAIEGLYPLINREFCKNEWREVTYINREQDLGHEGLRKAKLSYNPVKMINKYTVNFI